MIKKIIITALIVCASMSAGSADTLRVGNVTKLRSVGDSLAFLGTYKVGGSNKTRLMTFKDLRAALCDTGITATYAGTAGLMLDIGGVRRWHLNSNVGLKYVSAAQSYGVGSQAIANNGATAYQNFALGDSALYANSAGDYNVARL